MQGGTSLLHHIIFNSIDVDEGKIYHSYYGSYMNIRNQSDRLCKEHNLSVINQEAQKEINEIKRRKFVNWYDWNEDKKGKSYKSRLQFDIDRIIKQSINWQDFYLKWKAAVMKLRLASI
ncbi:relaxase/mobilization nuclease domain-containing protein [Streptococcus equi]|uniref:relaxase/mobilization nuclease domain-containing protein n=1 Tax=Streptococcus equi TaxID=1336 RepID=UPI002F2B90E4